VTRLRVSVFALTVLCGASLWGQGSATSSTVDRAKLLEDLRLLSSDEMEGRAFGQAGGARARAYLVRRFRESGVLPIGDSYERPVGSTDRAGARTGANVMGVIRGTARADRYIVFSAHYDHVGMRGGQVFNGADDNASGTAALFGIAAYFRTHPPTTSLLLVAFDGEEAGLVGSRAFVRAPPVPIGSILVNVNADMIGRDPRNLLFVVGTNRFPALRPFIERVAARAPVTLRMGHEMPESRGEDDWTRDSDQYAFMEANIPALYIGVEDYDQHHQPTDDFETITYDFYVRAVDTIIEIVREFDRGADALVALRAGPAGVR